MKRSWSRFVTFAALLSACALASIAVHAADASPLGLWKTIDDETGKPKSLVRITEVNGELRSKNSVDISPSMTISALAGTSRSLVLH